MTDLRALARRAARDLALRTGLPVRVRRGDRCATARVLSDTGFALSVSVGEYPAVGKRPWATPVAEWLETCAAAPRVLSADVSADAEWLRDGRLATEGSFGREHAYREFATLDEALAWVATECRPLPIPRVSSVELLEWERRRVEVDHPVERRRTSVTLAEAARIFGVIYGARVSAARLVSAHHLSQEDARDVEAAVRKVLPSVVRADSVLTR